MEIEIGSLELVNIVFQTNENWILKIEQDGTIIFNEKVKLDANEFAKEFINIVETNTFNKANKIREIVQSYEYKDTEHIRFSKEEDKDWVKARLFDKICSLF